MDKVLALHNSLSINLLVLGIFRILVSAIDDLHLKDLISSRKELSVEYVSAPRY